MELEHKYQFLRFMFCVNWVQPHLFNCSFGFVHNSKGEPCTPLSILMALTEPFHLPVIFILNNLGLKDPWIPNIPISICYIAIQFITTSTKPTASSKSNSSLLSCR